MTPNDKPGAAPEPGLRKVAELESELARATRRIESLEASTSLRVGRLIVDAARAPRTAIRLPFQLMRLARRRGRRPSTAISTREGSRRAPSLEATRTRPTEDERRRFLSHTAITLGARTRFSIAGIVRPSTERALSPDALFNRLLPHDARLVLERVEPDLVLVETAAFRAGLPWAFTGDPAATDRARDLREVIEVAQALGRPIVLWRNTPDHEAIGVASLESRFDLVVPEGPSLPLEDWSIGIQLADANPVGAPATRSRQPVLVTDWDPRAPLPLRRAVADALLAIPDLRILAREADAGDFPERLAPLIAGQTHDPPDTYRRHAVVVADPFAGPSARDDAIVAAACGARVVTLLPTPLHGLEGVVIPAGDPDGLPPAVANALAAGPVGDRALRVALRAIYRDHAPAVMLDRLRRRLLVEAHAAGARSVAMIAATGQDETHGAGNQLRAVLRSQEMQPTEVLITGDAGELVHALVADGIAPRAVPDGTRAAAATDAAWLWPWHPGAAVQPTTLLDLLLAAEIGRADVACLVDGPGGFGVDPGPGEFLIRTTVALGSPSLDLAGPDGWRAAGLRTFGLAAVRDGERP